MKLDIAPEKLRLLPVQLIHLDDAVVIKRGRTEIKVVGERAREVLLAIIKIGLTGAARTAFLEPFGQAEQQYVESLINHLISRHLIIVDGADRVAEVEPDTNQTIFYWQLGTNLDEVRGRFRQKRIQIIGVNRITRRLVEGLSEIGATLLPIADEPLTRNPDLFDEKDRLRSDQWPDQLGLPVLIQDNWQIDPETFDCIVATSDYGAVASLRHWNEFCILHKKQLFPILLSDLVGYVGPLVVPGETACYECVLSRQDSHHVDPVTRRVIESVVADADNRLAPGFHTSMASILGDIALLELIKLLGLETPLSSAGTLVQVNLLASEMTPRRVLRVPRCEVCSNLNQRAPVALTRTELFGTSDGQR